MGFAISVFKLPVMKSTGMSLIKTSILISVRQASMDCSKRAKVLMFSRMRLVTGHSQSRQIIGVCSDGY